MLAPFGRSTLGFLFQLLLLGLHDIDVEGVSQNSSYTSELVQLCMENGKW